MVVVGWGNQELSFLPPLLSPLNLAVIANTAFPASIVTLWIVRVKNDANEGNEYLIRICTYLE